MTGVVEDNVRTFTGNWTGTGAIENAGDAERLVLEAGEYMISEMVDTGAVNIELDYNHYLAGDAITLEYRHGATPNACDVAAWNAYVAPFVSLGYVQIKLTSTL